MSSWLPILAIAGREGGRTHLQSRPRIVLLAAFLLEFLVALTIVLNVSAMTQRLFPTGAALLSEMTWAFAYAALGVLTVAGLSRGTSMPAQIIGQERSRNTWTLVRAAPIRSWEWIAALLGGTLSPTALLALAHVPPLAFCAAAMGPGQQANLFLTAAICCGLWLLSAAIGLASATNIRRVSSAMSLGVLVVLVYAIGIYWIVGAVVGLLAFADVPDVVANGVNAIESLARSLSPFSTCFRLGQGKATANDLALTFAGLIAVTAASLWIARRGLDREKPLDAKPQIARPRPKSEALPIPPAMLPMRDAIPDDANPVYVRELRCSYFGRFNVAAYFLLGSTAVAFILASVVAVTTDWSDGAAARTSFWSWTFAAMIVPNIAAAQIMTPMLARERDQDTLEMLALTTQSPDAIFFGKLSAAAVLVLPAFLIFVAAYLPLWAAGAPLFTVALASSLTLAVCMTLEVAAGACATVIGRSEKEATTFGRMLCFALLFGLPALILGISALESSFIDGQSLTLQLLPFTSPLAALMWILVQGSAAGYLKLLISLGLYMALAVYLLRFARVLFRQRILRAAAQRTAD